MQYTVQHCTSLSMTMHCLNIHAMYLGEVVAKMQLYAVFTTILSKFTVTTADGTSDTSPVPERVMVGPSAPKPFKMMLLPRSH